MTKANKKIIHMPTKSKRRYLGTKEIAKFLGSLQIESGNSIPGRISVATAYYPFLDKLKAGQNIYFEDERFADRLYNAAKAYGKKHDKVFSMKQDVSKAGNKRFGLWRVK